MMHTAHQSKPSLCFAILMNLGLALLLVSIENLLIFSGLGFSSSGTSGGDFIYPIPGWVIGAIWTALFASLGVDRAVMEADGSPAARRASWSVLILLVACAAYPFYTLGLRNEIIGLCGNILTMLLSAWAAARIGVVWRGGAIAPLAVMCWVAFATLATLDGGDLFG